MKKRDFARSRLKSRVSKQILYVLPVLPILCSRVQSNQGQRPDFSPPASPLSLLPNPLSPSLQGPLPLVLIYSAILPFLVPSFRTRSLTPSYMRICVHPSRRLNLLLYYLLKPPILRREPCVVYVQLLFPDVLLAA